MRVFGLLFCLLSLPLIASTQLTTQVHDVDYGVKSDDEILVFLTSGHVAKLRPEQSRILKEIDGTKSLMPKWYKITMDRNRYITKLELGKAPLDDAPIDFNSLKSLNSTYVPTTIPNMETAQRYHRSARLNGKDSQCFNRAMIWSYEWWKKHSLRSMKLFIFFTRTYIRRYNFEWWFHIAPYVHVRDGERVVERVMDIKYTRGPREFKQWSDIFMRNNATCPIITKYSDYADYPYQGECYYMRTHMYTYQPADLQMYEAWGYKKEGFVLREIQAAYLEAFDERY